MTTRSVLALLSVTGLCAVFECSTMAQTKTTETAAAAGSAAVPGPVLAAGKGELVEGPSKPVARFVAPSFTEADAVATFALKAPLKKGGELPADYKVKPQFGKTGGTDDRHIVHIPIEAGTSLYGTGEVAGPLKRNGFSVETWNTDAYGYDINSPSLYQSHPWVLAVRADGTAFGVLVDTTWRTQIDLSAGITFRAQGKAPPVYIIDRSSPQEVVTALTELIGPMPLPPKWALGYHQCRYSYFPEARVREIAEGFRSRKMPASVIWFDIDYMDKYKTFTFDKGHFPDPAKLNADLEAMGFRCIWMINPGIKKEKGWSLSDDLLRSGYEVKTATGESFSGAVWPGPCNFPDYTSDQVRGWWAGLYRAFMAAGIDGVWNDMNEPAIFDVASKTMPENNQHRGGLYSSGPGVEPQKVTAGDHARFHNVYGMLMAQATFEGIKTANTEKRPFVLTRAGYIGSQRYAATWTGDNAATWTDLEQSIPMAINLGISGQPFAGPDIGGFIGNGPGDAAEKADHFTRWMGIGTFLPFMRGHTAKGNIDKEPWSFGPDAETANRLTLQRRYRFLPYIYTLFREASTTGMPVVRPLFFVDPKDQGLRGEDDAFLMGDILVVPQLMPDRTRVLTLPKGIWRSFDVVDAKHPALPEIKLRGGSIVPVGPLMQFHNEKPLDELALVVSLDDKGQAKGMLYEDAEDGFGYQKGEYTLSTYSARTEGDNVIITLSTTEGTMPRRARTISVQVLTDSGTKTGSGEDGKPITIKLK